MQSTPPEAPTAGTPVHTHATLSAWFDAVSAEHADRVAVTIESESLTYRELHAAAQRVASGLSQRGIGQGALVGILMERSLEMVVAMLGVVQAGAAYLPLDTRYPEGRITQTVADAEPAAVLVARGAERELSGIPCLVMEDLYGTCMRSAAAEVTGADRAYVIYTSGSTGRPKGVEVTHGNLVRLLEGTQKLFHFDENDVWTMFHSFAFDFSVWEIWGALLHGGRLVLVPYAVSRASEEFHRLLASERVTVLNQTPSAFLLLDQVEEHAANKLSLRVIIFGGEALPPSMLRGWFVRHGDQKPELVNMYGITETTVHVTYRRMLDGDAGERDSLIGEPLPGVTIALLGDDMQPVTDGAEGEICVGGSGVARGYLNRPELTAERFVDGPDGRFYRSGDMARRRPGGELVYLGRRDGQVKIAGFRIELGEVDAALAAHPGVAQGCVVTQAGPDGADRLVAYFVGRTSTILHTRELSEFLAGRLPAHMMPSVYRQLQAFPLNSNGKIDRGALPVETSAAAAAILAGDEARVARVWTAVLDSGQVGPEDNFFDVGGTSLLLVRVRAGLEAEFGRAIPVTWMFECTTIKTMAERLGTESGADLPMKDVQGNAARQRQAFARARAMRSVQK